MSDVHCISVVSVALLKGRSDRHRIPMLSAHACQRYRFSRLLPRHSSYSCCSPRTITLIKSPNAKAIEILKGGLISPGLLSNLCFQYNLLKWDKNPRVDDGSSGRSTTFPLYFIQRRIQSKSVTAMEELPKEAFLLFVI